DGLLIINFLNDRGFSEGESPEELPILPLVAPSVWDSQQDTDSGDDDNTNELNLDDRAFLTDINAYHRTSAELQENASWRSGWIADIESDERYALDSILEEIAADILSVWNE
ncbi:MAG: hypothetical protein KDB11_32735, partial [Planctomycetales bacterium]|nr:hypothetical protein [Planctomycetales bacterium]